MRQPDEGLGLSLFLYAGAMIGGLALAAGPVLWANTGRSYENPALSGAAQAVVAPAYASSTDRLFPVAMLKHAPIVDPAVVAKINERSEPARPARAASVRLNRHYAEAPQAAPTRVERPHGPASFFLSLFGG